MESFLSLREGVQFPEVMGTDSIYLTHFILRKLYLVINHNTDKTDIKDEYHFFLFFLCFGDINSFWLSGKA